MENEQETDDEQVDELTNLPEAEDDLDASAVSDTFLTVGIGASAGGLEALELFFQQMPADSGIAFIVLQHSDPNYRSLMVELLKNRTAMKVIEVTDTVPIERNSVYIIPRSRDANLTDGLVRLVDPQATVASRMPIDTLFESLAEGRHELAAGIVLSGSNTDGTLGIRAIKGLGGLTIAQAPETAQYDRMPQSAISSGMIDFILSPEEMPDYLIRYAAGVLQLDGSASSKDEQEDASFQRVFSVLRTRTGHDFSNYKKSTLHRRIARRMTIQQIGVLHDYVRFLMETPEEINVLFRELLVGVTSFFRDPAAFDLLEHEITPQLFKNKRGERQIRIWIAGCATGEEAYSIAILLQEYMDELDQDYKVQIFATDINDEAIQEARAGTYPSNIASQITPKRLQRFFAKQDDHYIVRKQVREMITFAVQSLIKDPPFSKLDLVCCRNLLIYLEPELQRRVIPLFHYVLNPDGYLFLGSSETLGQYANLFEPIDRKWKIFQKVKGSNLLHAPFELPSAPPVRRPIEPIKARTAEPISLRQLIEQMILEDYTSPCAVVNDQGDIVYLHKQTDKYLRPVTGEISINILDMAREGLKLPLTTALRQVRMSHETVFYKNILVKKNGDYTAINLKVSRVERPEAVRGFFIVIFQDIDQLDTDQNRIIDADPNSESAQRIVELEHELGTTKEYLQAVVEELEASNEELKSTNEELNASNEELQSANEELETATEELQSVNEELSTANSELENKVTELTQSTGDLYDLIHNIDVGIIFLDRKLRIQRFTPLATRFVNLIEGDIGRPLSDLVSKLDYDGVLTDAQAVLDTLQPRRMEVRDDKGIAYWMILRPYQTIEGAIVGVVITFVNISEQKLLQERFTELEHVVQEQGQTVLSLQRVNRLFRRFAEHQRHQRSSHLPHVFLSETCHIIVEIERYDVALVKMIEADQLRLVAITGNVRSDVQAVEASSARMENHTDPAWQVIETRQSMVIRSTDSVGVSTAFLEAFAQKGYVSAIILPLQTETSIIGTLNIYSKSVAFGEQEINLLQKFAEEVAWHWDGLNRSDGQ